MQRIPSFGKQSGVVLFVAMIALVVLMIAAVALIRSTDTAQAIAGNLAVKRDLTHESELAVQVALAKFASGGPLAGEAARTADLALSGGGNYFASVQASNPMGIPFALMQASASSGEAAGYNTGVTYRYMIDRMCPAAGLPLNCITGRPAATNNFINDVDPSAGAGTGLGKRTFGSVYRISIRVTDSRSTQSYFQTTFMSTGS